MSKKAEGASWRNPWEGRVQEIRRSELKAAIARLAKYKNAVGPEGVRAMAEVDAAASADEYVTNRKAGRQNEYQSIGRGVRILVDESGKRELIRSGVETPEAFSKRGKKLFQLEYPEGIYDATGDDGLLGVTKEVPPDFFYDGWPSDRKDEFTIGTRGIVRVEGKQGEVFQNSQFTVQGVRKPSARR